MSERILIEPEQLRQSMHSDPFVLIDTRDPAVYAQDRLPARSICVKFLRMFRWLFPKVWSSFSINSLLPSAPKRCCYPGGLF